MGLGALFLGGYLPVCVCVCTTYVHACITLYVRTYVHVFVSGQRHSQTGLPLTSSLLHLLFFLF